MPLIANPDCLFRQPYIKHLLEAVKAFLDSLQCRQAMNHDFTPAPNHIRHNLLKIQMSKKLSI